MTGSTELSSMVQTLVQQAIREQLLPTKPGRESTSSEAPAADRAEKIRNLVGQTERTGSRAIEHLLPILHDSSSRLRTACHTSMQDGIDWLEWTNRHRWSRGQAAYPSGETAQQGLDKHRANLEELRNALADFRQSDHLQLLEPFRDLFDAETGNFKNNPDNMSDTDTFRLSTRSLFLTFVFVTNLVSYATTLVEFLEVLLKVEARSPRNKIQWPFQLNKAVKVATSRDGASVNPLDIGSDSTDENDDDTSTTDSSDNHEETKKRPTKEEKRRKTEQRRKTKYALDPDAERPRNALQRFLRTIGFAWAWQSSPEGLFALRYALVSIALWVPAICPSSVYFTYVNRGLWYVFPHLRCNRTPNPRAQGVDHVPNGTGHLCRRTNSWIHCKNGRDLDRSCARDGSMVHGRRSRQREPVRRSRLDAVHCRSLDIPATLCASSFICTFGHDPVSRHVHRREQSLISLLWQCHSHFRRRIQLG